MPCERLRETGKCHGRRRASVAYDRRRAREHGGFHCRVCWNFADESQHNATAELLFEEAVGGLLQLLRDALAALALVHLIDGDVELGAPVLGGHDFDRGVGVGEELIRDLPGKQPSLYLAALKESEADVFECRRELPDTEIEVLNGKEMPLLAQALQGLVFCAIEAGNLAADNSMQPYLGLDDDKRALAKMPELVARFSSVINDIDRL